ncbi:UNVERIFIED_CONTAM: hypothetical protein Sradi_3063200 [Sesamum radiatum]|uniref:Calmodulin-binding domain-containing protein n=1 Tax=Sesamum radiatum TaxID=300843 RepID=A0AAW2RBH5_SESRA
MAEESIDSSVTPEKSELDGRIISRNAGSSGSLNDGHSTHARRSRALSGSYHAGDGLTRHSTVKSDSANGSQNVVPHYLRASTGSCHDFCKYGRKHSFENEARKPLRKRITKPFPNELNTVRMIVSDEWKKEKIVNHKPPADGQNLPSDQKPSPSTKSCSPDPMTSSDKGKVVKQKSSTSTKNHSSALKPSTYIKSFSQKPKTCSDVKTYSAGENASPVRKTLLRKNKPSSSEKFPSPGPPEIIKSVVFPSKRVEVPAESASSTDNKMSRPVKKTTYPSKQHLAPVKSKAVMVESPSCSDNSDGIRGKGRRNSDAKTFRDITTSKASAKKFLAPPAATQATKNSPSKTASARSRKAGNLKLMTPVEDWNRIRKVKTEPSDEKMSEKTLHVIEKFPVKERNRIHKAKTKPFDNEKASEKTLLASERETQNSVPQSTPHDHADSSLPSTSSAESLCHEKSSSLPGHEQDNKETEGSVGEADKLISDSNESLVKQTSVGEADKLISDSGESLETGNLVKENHAKTLRKTRVVVSENKYSSPVKLKFRSGKVVDLQSDNNGPRRLRFRRARVLKAEDGKADMRGRIFKKTGVKDDANGVSSQKVIFLKHQGVQRKRDAKGLLNNVSEEKASKLVESWKSKFPVKDRKRIRKVKTNPSDHEKVSEKTLHAIENETQNSVVQSVPDGHAVPSLSSTSSGESQCHEKAGHGQDNEETEESVGEAGELTSENDESLETGKSVKENQTKTLIKSRVVGSENKYSSPVKLKFRSGKVVDLQSDNNGPRRLRFRRARVLGAEDGNDLRGRTFKKSGVSASGVQVSSGKVVLKHQDVQGKRDAQGLLNNVIEETASKLVESRKSKVKALVGAFETVISLQESKPSSQTVTCIQ